MNTKSRGIVLGIVLGAALGIVLGVMAGHIALWLGVGMAIGIAIGSTMRRTTCARCEAAKRNQPASATSSQLVAHSS
jgi:F0F1-type ATP synthase assembly protein I